MIAKKSISGHQSRKVKIAHSGEHRKQDLDKMITAKQLLSMFFQWRNSGVCIEFP